MGLAITDDVLSNAHQKMKILNFDQCFDSLAPLMGTYLKISIAKIFI
jgi:hypothetical protein